MRNNRLLTVGAVLLALAFLGAGAAKVLQLDFEIQAFERFGLPIWLMVMVGVVEIVAAGLLLRRDTATLGAIVGVAIMLVAIPSHVAAREFPQAVVPLLFLLAFVAVGWQRREGLVTLLTEPVASERTSDRTPAASRS